MAKFHVNSKGEPGPCKARVSCPFGDLDADHYPTEQAAREAYEKKQGGGAAAAAPAAKKLDVQVLTSPGVSPSETPAVALSRNHYTKAMAEVKYYEDRLLNRSLDTKLTDEERKFHATKRREAQELAEKRLGQLEARGLGHIVPDTGDTIRVRNMAQKRLLENELKGQISDGMWENTPGNHWEVWTRAKVIVDPENVGRNFWAQKDNYQLNSRELLSAVGDRMIAEVQRDTGEPYDEKTMAKDLRDLRKIFKTQRKEHTAVAADDAFEREKIKGVKAQQAPAPAPAAQAAPKRAPKRAPQASSRPPAPGAAPTKRIPKSASSISSPKDVFRIGQGTALSPTQIKGRLMGKANPISGEGLNGRASGEVFIVANADGTRARIYKGSLGNGGETQLGRQVNLSKEQKSGAYTETSGLYVLGYVDANGNAKGWVPDQKLNYFQQ